MMDDQFADSVEAVRHLYDALSDEDFGSIIFEGGTVRALTARLTHFERLMPSWLYGTPEDTDAWLRSLIPDDKRLVFYQWIGQIAVNEALTAVRRDVAEDPVPPEHRSYSQEGVYEFLDTAEEGPYPSLLPIGRPFCDNSQHAHTHGGCRLPSCRLDSPE